MLLNILRINMSMLSYSCSYSTLLLILLVLCIHHDYNYNNNDKGNNNIKSNMALATSIPNSLKPYELPLLPSTLPPISNNNNNNNNGNNNGNGNGDGSSYEKRIPRMIWIAVKDKNDELPGHLKAFFARNPKWTVNICDNNCKDEYIKKVWGNTSVEWAYNIIHPAVGAARADIWRYCVLYTHGGVYLDDDSDMGVPLDEIIGLSDSLILSEEGKSSLGPCYVSDYFLSDEALAKKYPNASSAAFVDTTSGTPQFFHGNSLVNWALFAAPHLELFERTLRVIVQLLTGEYTRKSYLMMTKADHKWKTIMCCTNFAYANVLKEMLLENAPGLKVPRVEIRDFARYKGRCKAISTAGDPTHYRKIMGAKGNTPLLREYAEISDEEAIRHLSGKLVQGNSREVFLVEASADRTTFQLRSFPDFDTFANMKFDFQNVHYVDDVLLNKIPKGPVLPSLSKPV